MHFWMNTFIFSSKDSPFEGLFLIFSTGEKNLGNNVNEILDFWYDTLQTFKLTQQLLQKFLWVSKEEN